VESFAVEYGEIGEDCVPLFGVNILHEIDIVLQKAVALFRACQDDVELSKVTDEA
jgi:hypothetical protein